MGLPLHTPLGLGAGFVAWQSALGRRTRSAADLGANSTRNGQLHTQGFADPSNGVQPGLCIGAQGFVKRFSFDAGGSGLSPLL